MNNFWHKVVDEMIRLSENDPELREALQYVDKNMKKGESFYTALFRVMYKDKKFKN